MMDSATREISEDEMKRLVREDDPRQVAVVLNEILADLGYTVLTGLGDNYGYYIYEQE